MDSAIVIIRVISPTFVLLSTLSLFFYHPPSPSTPSPITSVVVATHVPRRSFILALLSLSALSFLLDGLTFVIYTVLDKSWPRNSAIPINSLLGLTAFAGLAALGSWKDIQGVDVWFLKRIKVAITTALGLDIALVVLLGISMQVIPNCKASRQIHYLFVSFISPDHSTISYPNQVITPPRLSRFPRLTSWTPPVCPSPTTGRLHRYTKRWKRRAFTHPIFFPSCSRIEYSTFHRSFCRCWFIR